jgi:arylsulfatase A-like enzyme
MKRIFLILLSVLLPVLFVIIIVSMGPGNGGVPQRIFLITLDTTRADHFDYRLTDNTLTPHFAKLASEGQYFENAYALIPITLPSHSSMFYSMPPHRMKLYNNGQVQDIPRPTVTQLLKGKGFHTGAVISLGVLKTDFGLSKGFEHYIENFKPYAWIKKADEVNRNAIELVKNLEMQKASKETGERSFYWLHYSDPHEPYFPPCEDGDFSVSFNGNNVFSCRSTEYALIKLNLELYPGNNTLVLNTVVPTALKNYKNCDVKVEYIKYHEFTVDFPSEEGENKPNDTGSPYSILPPVDWTQKEEDGVVDYYSKNLHSEITIRNPRDKTVTVELHFLYSMHVDEAARKEFYKEEIRYMDRTFGEFVDFLKKQDLYKGSAFIVMGDHGEGLGEYHGLYGHVHFLNKIFTRVPLIAAGTGIPKKGKREEVVSTLNIAPTILDLAGAATPDFMQGQSLLKPIFPRKLLLETYSPEAFFDAFSLIDFPWQIIFYPGRQTNKLEFINLKTDALGTIDLNNINTITGEAKSDSVKKIKTGLINSVLKISRILTATKGKFGNTSERHREILKSLGYL